MSSNETIQNSPATTPSNAVLNRVLAEVRAAELSEASTTAHSSYVSGIFESADNQVIDRVLAEVRAAESSEAKATAHSTYVSGLFE